MTFKFASLASALAIVAISAGPVAASAPSVSARPLLGTSDQEQAEELLRELLTDPGIKAEQARIKNILAKTDIGQIRDGAARLDEVIAQWTNSLIFKELLAGRTQPVILWGTDDTPRHWFGYTLGGVGTSGDNPDHIYRSSQIDGDGRYEITGKFDPARRPAQFVLSVSHTAEISKEALAARKANFGRQFALIDDRQVKVAPDGSFRVTLGGSAPAGSANHIALEPGALAVGFRDVLSDWKQLPSALSIRRLDSVTGAPFDKAALKARVIANFEPYVGFWSSFPVTWLGGLKPNTVSSVVPRDGGWGYLAGIRYALAPDEAILVTTSRAGAKYAGIQVVDPWMIASDARKHQTSINPAQAKPNADGSYSFVIAPNDPGVWNWLDTATLHDGFAVLRWQNLPAGTTGDGLLRDFRVIKSSDAAKLPGIATITAAERKSQIEARADGYANRTRRHAMETRSAWQRR